MPGYNEKHAKAGLKVPLPRLETFPNQFPNYVITIENPEYNAICPKTGLPDFGTVTIEYEPVDHVLELKSFKTYITAYRNVGIFYENAVNRILADIVKAVKPKWCRATMKFHARGGISSTVEAVYPPDLMEGDGCGCHGGD
jgi:7-cyano-7-deazaguanine reductase